MLQGNILPEGAPVMSNIALLLGFFTIIMEAAQEEDLVIRTLDIFQTLIAWPSFNEGLLLTICIWSFRGVERIMGSSLLLAFLTYGLLVFLPAFLSIVLFKGFRLHFSLFYFVPYSLYICTMWEIPATQVASFLSDKLLVSLMFVIAIILSFPYSLFTVICAIISNILWSFDVFRLKKWCEIGESVISEEVGAVTIEESTREDQGTLPE
jgi:hypothetical protein